MYVQYSLHIDGPIEAVSSALLDGPRKWFPHMNDSSEAPVGPSVLGLSIRKKVCVTIGKPIKGGSWVEVPVTWRATSIQRLFPLMTGKVELAPVDADLTRLTVCGMYEPPLGKIGKQLDEAFMHKVALATIRELADTMAKRLTPTPAA